MTRTALGRAVATATAAISTLALGATSANAAALGPAQFSGAAKAQSVQLTLEAPSSLLGLLGAANADQLLDLGVSLTEVTSSSTNQLAASSHLLTGLLAEGASSDADGDSYQSAAVPAQQIGPVFIGAGTNSYNIDRATGAVNSMSELARVSITLDSVLGAATPAAGVLDDVADVVDTVADEVDALAGDIIAEINGVVNELEQTLEDAAGLVLDIPDVNLSDVNVVRDLAETAVLDIRKMWSVTSVTPLDGKVRSSAEAGVLNASILGGLVEIPEWTFTAWAEAAGTPGSATWGGDTRALALNVLGEELVSLDGSVLNIAGVELDLNDPSLSGIVPDEIAGELDGLIGELLNLTGLSVQQGRLTGEAAQDGSFATATASAFSISLAPLHAATALPELEGLVNSLGLGTADELFRLQLDLLPVTATATAAPAPAPATPSLPRTGGGAAAMALGMLSIGGAGLLRRKF